MSIPNPENFCGGNFQDWLEVNLIDKCNASCPWCVEKQGWHPKHHASWKKISEAALATGKQNIILLGGEPTLYHYLKILTASLQRAGRNVWMTTNGSLLTSTFVASKLKFLTGINISVHHYLLARNKEITGLTLDEDILADAVEQLLLHDVNVRFNCNVIAGEIDSRRKIETYVHWAKSLGAQKVRFAELKNDDDKFGDLAEILDHEYGLNDDPFCQGCHCETEIAGIPVNFRQMCGLHTSRRASPDDPHQYLKEVLYYDGKIYQGWQMASDAKHHQVPTTEQDDGSFDDFSSKVLDFVDPTGGKSRAKHPQPVPASGGGAGCQY